MPMAAIGPRLRFEFRSENSRHSSARMTVAAEAAIGANADLYADQTASHFDLV